MIKDSGDESGFVSFPLRNDQLSAVFWAFGLLDWGTYGDNPRSLSSRLRTDVDSFSHVLVRSTEETKNLRWVGLVARAMRIMACALQRVQQTEKKG